MKRSIRALSAFIVAAAALSGPSAIAAGRDSVYANPSATSTSAADTGLSRHTGRDSVYASDVPRVSPPSKGTHFAGNGRGSVFARG